MALGSLALLVVPVLAPTLAAEANLAPSFVGAYRAALWSAAIVASAACAPLLRRHGPWPLLQACLLLCAAGVAAVLSGEVWGLVLGALLIGLGQGLEGPAASQLLSLHVPLARRPLWFSVKQTGVQVGAIVASAALPLLALLAGWRVAAVMAAAAAALGALALGVPRRRYPALPAAPEGAAAGVGALAMLRRVPGLGWLALAAAAFGAVQVCLNGFFVTFAVAERGASLVEAGRWLAAAQAGGLIGRLLWGWIGMRSGAALPVLLALGLGMTLCAAAVGLFAVTLMPALLWPLLFVFGLTASGWNGIFLAEVARQAPVHQAGAATAAVLVVMTAGLVVGPLLFSALGAAASFGFAFLAFAGVSLAGVLALAKARSATRS